MFSIVPTSAAPPTQSTLPALLASAKATVGALAPHVSHCRADGTTVTFTFRKVASCHRFYSALLRSDGALFLLTTSSRGHAISPVTDCVASVSLLESGGEAVRDVAAGASHIVYCTVSGAVYSCGYDNTYGQLGDGTVWASSSSPLTCPPASNTGDAAIPPLSAPRRISGFGDTSASAAARDEWSASDTSCASANDAAGATQKAGAEPSSPMRHVPSPCSRHIRQVACGAHHTLLLTQTGRCVYACGRGDRGELGSARTVLVQPSYRSIPLLFGLEMRQVAAADAHSFVLLENGLLYAFGDNVCGQLGLGTTKQVSLPTSVPLSGQNIGAEGLLAPAATPSVSSAARSLPLDAKAYASLRAPYGSAASSYYPLRVPRLAADKAHAGGVATSSALSSPAVTANAADACVRWVHCCGSWTLLETDQPDVWLSCGTALTRGAAPTAPASRIDGCGVLGRALAGASTAEALRFLPVQWPSLLRASRGSWDVEAAPPVWAREEAALNVSSRSLGPQHPHTREEEEAGSSHTRCTVATTAVGDGGAAYNSASSDQQRHRLGSDTEVSLCHTKNPTKGDEVVEGGVRVCPYATTLLVLLGDEEGWAGPAGDHTRDASAELFTSRLLVQSGASSAMAIEVPIKGSLSWQRLSGVSVDREVAADGSHADHRAPSGASVLKVRSCHQQFIPLPAYALFL